MLLIGNLNLLVYFGINEGIQILTIIILALILLFNFGLFFGIFLVLVPLDTIGGPSCSGTSDEYCVTTKPTKDSWTSQSCKVFGLSID